MTGGSSGHPLTVLFAAFIQANEMDKDRRYGTRWHRDAFAERMAKIQVHPDLSTSSGL